MDAYSGAIAAAMIGSKLNVLCVEVIAMKSPVALAIVELPMRTCVHAPFCLLQKTRWLWFVQQNNDFKFSFYCIHVHAVLFYIFIYIFLLYWSFVLNFTSFSFVLFFKCLFHSAWSILSQLIIVSVVLFHQSTSLCLSSTLTGVRNAVPVDENEKNL